MNNFKLTITAIFIFIATSVFSQQEITISQYWDQMNTFNPAAAGLDEEFDITTTLRQQWSSIEYAPETMVISSSFYVGKNVGLGFSVIQDKTFIEESTFVGVDFSYKLKLDEKSDLYLGIKAGGDNYSVNTSGIEAYSVLADPALINFSSFSPNVGLGVYYKRNKLDFSVSVPRALTTKRANEENGIAIFANSRPHFYSTLSYEINMSNANIFVLKPRVLYKYVNGAPSSIDFNPMLMFGTNIEKFGLGPIIRDSGSFGMIFQMNVNDFISFGFAYESEDENEIANAGYSNEILISIKL